MSIKVDNSEFTQEELDIIKTIKVKEAMDNSLSVEHQELINRYLKSRLDIEKIVSPMIEFQKQMTSFSIMINNSINQTISRIQPMISNINNTFNSMKNPILSCMNTISELLKDIDFDEFHLKLIAKLLSEEQHYYEKFLEKSIFPPIFFIGLENEADEINNRNLNIDMYLRQENLKKYYSDRISSWCNNDIEGYPNELINDIKFSYDNNRVYSVNILLFVLLEYRVRNINNGKEIPKNNGKITKSIRNNLKENVFNPTESQNLYEKFIDSKGDSDIYKSTDKNPNSITRHVLHGDKLELITYESMMSVVFLYDFINEVLSYKN